MTPIRAATILDLPGGGFLVLDHLVKVWAEPPYSTGPAGRSPQAFSVMATTAYSTEAHVLALFPSMEHRVGAMAYLTFADCNEGGPLYEEAKAAAEDFVAEIRAALS